MEFILWITLLTSACISTSIEAVPVASQNTFVELDERILKHIELATEDIARNSTKEFVNYEIQAIITLFMNNLNITIEDLQKYTNKRNSTDFDDDQMKDFQRKGLIMYENTAMTMEYVTYKIGFLTKSIDELEEVENYIINKKNRLNDLSNISLQTETKSALDKIQTTKLLISKHLDYLKHLDNVLKELSNELMIILKKSNRY